MTKLIFSVVFLLSSLMAISQKKDAFVIYNAKGKKVSYKKMLRSVAKKDVIFFGELHNNPISHWLQLELTKDLYAMDKQLILGAEMIERDDQAKLEAYLKGEIDFTSLDTTARLWPNYKTDYAPLVDFAKEHGIDFIGTNIPRRFANQVFRNGFGYLDTLSEEEKAWVAPLPIPFDPNLPTYIEILEMMEGHGTPELVKAQATKDATMAYFIHKNYKKGYRFLHFNGSFHSDKYEGIVWYLKKYNPNLSVATITTVSQADVYKLLQEHKHRADFIICVDEDMTTTY